MRKTGLVPALVFLTSIIFCQSCYKMNMSRTGATAGASQTMTSGATLPASTTSTASSGSTTAGGMTPSSSPIPLGPNFSSLWVNIFSPKCVSCHSGMFPSGNYDMTTYSAIIGTGHVVPGSPTTSPLYLRSADMTMPPGAPLSAAELQAMYTWIANGAANDGPVVTTSPSPTPTPIPLMPTFKSIQANILNKSCISCHNAMNAAHNYSVQDYNSTLQMVVPFNSAKSGLYTSLLRNMPPGAPLTNAEIAAVKTWIDDGALDN